MTSTELTQDPNENFTNEIDQYETAIYSVPLPEVPEGYFNLSLNETRIGIFLEAYNQPVTAKLLQKSLGRRVSDWVKALQSLKKRNLITVVTAHREHARVSYMATDREELRKQIRFQRDYERKNAENVYGSLNLGQEWIPEFLFEALLLMQSSED